jgi:hypothetical protein
VLGLTNGRQPAVSGRKKKTTYQEVGCSRIFSRWKRSSDVEGLDQVSLLVQIFNVITLFYLVFALYPQTLNRKRTLI